MTKVVINIVKWNEKGSEVFQHTGRTFELDTEDLGLDSEREAEVGIDSKYPLQISEKTFVAPDGKTIRNIAINHKLIGLISDYYIYNEAANVDEKDK